MKYAYTYQYFIMCGLIALAFVLVPQIDRGMGFSAYMRFDKYGYSAIHWPSVFFGAALVLSYLGSGFIYDLLTKD